MRGQILCDVTWTEFLEEANKTVTARATVEPKSNGIGGGIISALEEVKL